MKQLPDQPQANSAKGIWFVFPDSEAIFKVWLSMLTGKEKVFANDELIYQTRNITRLHTTYDLEYRGKAYELEIKTVSLMVYTIECNLFREGRIIGAQLCKINEMGLLRVDELVDREKPQARALSRYRSTAHQYLQEYDLAKAKAQYQWVTGVAPEDAESYFYLACIASLEEDVVQAIQHLETALNLSLNGQNRILSIDHLAYLRIQPEFASLRDKYGF